MKKDRVLFFADHDIGYSCISWILENQESKLREITIYSPERPKNCWWRDLRDLPIKIKNFNSSCIEKDMTAEDVDYIFLLSWKYIIPENLIRKAKKSCFNLHYSNLPDYKGVYPINWQIIKGEKLAGVTIHKVTSEIDGGPIVWQNQTTAIATTDTASSLLLKLDQVAFNGFKKVFLERETIRNEDWAQKHIGSYYSKSDFEKMKRLKREDVSTEQEWSRLQRGLQFNVPEKKKSF